MNSRIILISLLSATSNYQDNKLKDVKQVTSKILLTSSVPTVSSVSTVITTVKVIQVTKQQQQVKQKEEKIKFILNNFYYKFLLNLKKTINKFTKLFIKRNVLNNTNTIINNNNNNYNNNNNNNSSIIIVQKETYYLIATTMLLVVLSYSLTLVGWRVKPDPGD